MIRLATTCMLFLSLHLSLLGQASIFNEDFKEHTFSEVEFIEDLNKAYNLNSILELEDSAWQFSNSETTINLDALSYWIKFSIHNNGTSYGDALFDFKNWSFLDLFYIEGNQLKQVYKTGHLRPYSERALQFANYNFIPIGIGPNETMEFYAKLDPAFNNMVRPTNLNFKVSDRSSVLKQKDRSNQLSFFFFGIYMIMLIYNLFIWISTKDKTYRFYLLSLVVYTIMIMDTSGMWLALFPNFNGMPELIKHFHTIQPHLITITVLLFIHDFLRLEERYPFWSKILKADVIAVLLMIIVLYINFDLGVNLTVFNTLPFVVIVFVVAIKSLRDKFPGALYLLIGHIFWFIGAIGAMLGQIHPTINQIEFFQNHSIFSGSAIEMIMFSLALANTINYLRKENEEKQKKIIHQLQENAQLQDTINRELETKVSLRTKEIFNQKEEINTQKLKLEKEKERSDGLLLNILPHDVADELKKTGKATPKYHEMVSILFVDITKFSNMVRNTNPKNLVEDLDSIFSAFDEIVEKYKLEKIKTIGDAYMCVCGLTDDVPNHALNTILASDEMIQFMKEWRKTKNTKSDDELNLRAGIHSGAVTAGVVGKIKFQFDIWGDAVNLASRMESNSKTSLINISETTYEMVKDYFICEYRGKFPVKNMGEVDMYFVRDRILEKE